MPNKCCAAYCSNRKSSRVSLHRFPLKEKKRLAAWNRFMRVKRADWKGPSRHSVLCSAHFLPTDYDRALQHEMGFHKAQILKQDAIPTIHAKPKMDRSRSSKKCGDEPVLKKIRSSSAMVKLSAHRVSYHNPGM